MFILFKLNKSSFYNDEHYLMTRCVLFHKQAVTARPIQLLFPKKHELGDVHPVSPGRFNSRLDILPRQRYVGVLNETITSKGFT